MEEQKKKGFLSGFGSGAIVVLAAALFYIFGQGEQPVPAITKSSLEVYVISTTNAQSLIQLKDVIPDLTDEQKAKYDKAADAFKTQAEGAKKALTLVNQNPPLVEVTITPANSGSDETEETASDASETSEETTE